MDSFLYKLTEKKLKKKTFMLREKVLMLNAKLMIELNVLQSTNHSAFEQVFTKKRKSINYCSCEDAPTSKRSRRIELHESTVHGRSIA